MSVHENSSNINHANWLKLPHREGFMPSSVIADMFKPVFVCMTVFGGSWGG